MGKVINRFLISPLSLINESGATFIETKIQKEVDFLLSLMPRETRYLGYKEEPVLTLAIPFTLEFEHPLFEDGTEIQQDWIRECWTVPGDIVEHLHQGNLFLGIRYIKPDGTRMHDECYKQ